MNVDYSLLYYVELWYPTLCSVGLWQSTLCCVGLWHSILWCLGLWHSLLCCMGLVTHTSCCVGYWHLPLCCMGLWHSVCFLETMALTPMLCGECSTHHVLKHTLAFITPRSYKNYLWLSCIPLQNLYIFNNLDPALYLSTIYFLVHNHTYILFNTSQCVNKSKWNALGIEIVFLTQM